MKRPSRGRILGLFLFIFAVTASTSCASGQDYSGYDLSTPERVNDAREAKLGRKIDSYSKGCVKVPEQLPGVVLIGSFAHDRGCELEEAIIQKRGVQADDAISKTALQSLGWGQAAAERRRELALNWVRFGLLAFEYSMMEGNKDFKGDRFKSPQAVANPDGGVAVSLWVQRASGMRCESGYDKFTYKFLADGSLGARTTEDSFTVPCKGQGND